MIQHLMMMMMLMHLVVQRYFDLPDDSRVFPVDSPSRLAVSGGIVFLALALGLAVHSVEEHPGSVGVVPCQHCPAAAAAASGVLG